MNVSFIFLILIVLIYLTWILIFIIRLDKSKKNNKNVDKEIKTEIQETIDNVYIKAISFEKSKNFTKALQKNLKHQIDSFISIMDLDYKLAVECLDCLKDTVDINDMTFYVGDELINSLLREKLRICYQKNIVLDVVADLSEIKIKKSHLFFIFSNIIDLVIQDIEEKNKINKNIENCKEICKTTNRINIQDFEKKLKKPKDKISIRASKGGLKNSNFFVLQIASDTNNSFDNITNYNKYIYNILSLLLESYNGVMIDEDRGYRHVKTIVIPLVNKEKQNIKL